MFYLFLLAHLTADFVLQPLWLVQRKRYWHGLLIHGAIVLACMLLLSCVDRRALALWPAMLLITAVHVCADWWKVRYGDRIPGPPIGPFMLDQVIHLMTLIGALSLWLPAGDLWASTASPAALATIYVSAYIIAVFAAPIAVMIWLDPRFEHVALAGRARVRSFVTAAIVLTLALFGGPLALPVTLAGLVAVIARRPPSAHPLDAPLGTMMVLIVGAGLGALLSVAM
ncbi:MAG: DUF3307 domain-containing protein [Chloroflexi bacterium]|nr:DUF3307 domain-containing protein [Chloroflexota bacterium]